jgi:hypothetical protein
METKHLKKYAPEARREFITAVKNKAAVYGLLPKQILPMKEEGDVVIIGDRPFPRTVAKQRKELEDRIKRNGFQQFIEAVAYTWFNRFVAIRYMELHGYLDHGYRVLSHPEGKSAPEILENAERIELPGLSRDAVVDLKLDGSKDEQLYQMLLLAQCNALHKSMPFLFESLKDGTELLLPDNLLHTDSLVRTLVNDIPEDQWENVEIIGWLYQFYISEKKDEVIGKVVKCEDIPAATQLFTPNWIVRYMLHNTLGRKWMATYPDSPLKQQMEFYIEPAEQQHEVQQQLDALTPDSLNPEELTLLDPACGSGHILVEAYDLFKSIYTERGYRARDIPKLILQKNLFGLEIDDRAAQLAAFSLLMKARQDDRRIFDVKLTPCICSIQNSERLDATEAFDALLSLQQSSATPKQFDLSHIRQVINLFILGKTYGSLISVPVELAEPIAAIENCINELLSDGGLFEKVTAESLLPLIKQAQMLSQQFDFVVTNPPYMGNKNMNGSVKEVLRSEYPDARADLFAAFIQRSLDLAKSQGHVGCVTPFVWMFLSSYSSLRQKILRSSVISTLTQLEYNAFEPACVPVATFTLWKTPITEVKGDFIRLTDFRGIGNQPTRTIEAIKNPGCEWRFSVPSNEFSRLPNTPISYWLPKEVRQLFSTKPALGTVAKSVKGLDTCDNDRFMRLWSEVPISQIGFSISNREQARESGKRWFPYCKGGSYRKWFGNQEFVVNWQHDGEELRNFRNEDGSIKSRPQSIDCYFRTGVTFSSLTSSAFSCRLLESAIFGGGGNAAFSDDPKALLAFLNSHITEYLMNALNPTLNMLVGDLQNLPYLIPKQRERLIELTDRLIGLYREDWDSQETSWDFKQDPLVSAARDTFGDALCAVRHAEMCRRREALHFEKEINDIFSEEYGLSGVLPSDVGEERISLIRMSDEDRAKSLVSFAVGCVMGRYSLVESGVTYAESENYGFKFERYGKFVPDEDGIIPITSERWFEDDCVMRLREFLSHVWPKQQGDSVVIELLGLLGKGKSSPPDVVLRKYLSEEFYKDHLSRYKGTKNPPRPIYWLFTSGKKRAFQCLVYLHRYNASTLSRMRTEYVVPLQGKMNARIEQLESDIPAANSTSHRKKLEKDRDTLIKQREELQSFDEKLRHYADQRIELNLDDGVKVNYGKFGDLLAEVKAITGGKSEE